MNDHYPATQEPVIVVGAGPAGCAAALLLADYGIPVDRVVAAVAPRCRLPRLPWPIPATGDRGSPVTAHPPAHPDHARPFPSTR